MAEATLDWPQCPAVESVPDRVSGAWVLRDTRVPVSVIFENLEYDSSIEEIIENYGVTREQIQAVLDFEARSAVPPQVSTYLQSKPSERHRSVRATSIQIRSVSA
jgi:uncharacterized protein (DUF433 family)